MKLKVENFGKIKSACVELNGYTILVGDNNSGKTYLMQLIYGVINALCNITNFTSSLFEEYPFKVNKENIVEFQADINKWLDDNKNKIVEDTFNNKLIIDSLSLKIDVDDITKDPFLFQRIESSDIEKATKKVHFSPNVDKTGDVFLGIETEEYIHILAKEQEQTKSFWITLFVDFLFESILSAIGSSRTLYLPVARSGLNLVYRDLMAAMVKPREYNLSSSLNMVPESKKLGLSKPVFDYLLFMQTYKPDENRLKKNKDIIDFINKKIIKGNIIHIGDEIRYITDNGVNLPLFLASSMVNELTPVVHLLSSVEPVSHVFYDEIETSQHPTTQIQLARLMNRLVNAGINLIVSTHSDTMAAAISNLVALSFAKNKEEKCEKLRYEKEDLLQKDAVHAYQFVKDENGQMVVSEIPKFNELGMGFDFSLFSEVSNSIFETAKIIYGDA